MALADGGHSGNCEFFETPMGANDADQRMKSLARARHEMVNRRLKTFEILGKKFQHKLNKHAVASNACVDITQMISKCQWELGDNGESKDGLFQINHCDNYWAFLSFSSQLSVFLSIICVVSGFEGFGGGSDGFFNGFPNPT